MSATLTNTAALVYVADLVTAALNAHDFGEGVDFKADRNYADFDVPLEDLDELRLDVVPMNHVTSELIARGAVGYDVNVNIALRKRFTPSETEPGNGRVDVAEVDRLVLLLEQIHEHLCGYQERELDDDVSWTDTKITDSYVVEHLRVNRQYTGLILCTFHVTRDLEEAA